MSNLRAWGELAIHWDQCLAMLASFFIISGVAYQTAPVLLPSLMEEFHVTEYEVSWVPAVFQLSKGFFAVPGGFAVARYGASRCIRVGALMLVLGGATLPLADSLGFIVAVHVLYGVAYNLGGLSVALAFQTSWFMQQRALAISILLTGFSLSGVAFPPFLSVIIHHYGWRTAALACPLALTVIVLPLSFFILRDGPFLHNSQEASGSRGSDGYADEVRTIGHPGSPQPASPGRQRSRQQLQLDEFPTASAAEGLEGQSRPRSSLPQLADTEHSKLPRSFCDSLRYEAVWHLSVMSFCQMYVVIAYINTLILYLKKDVGLPLTICSLYNSIVFMGSVAGKLLVGPLLDTSRQRVVGIFSCVLLVVGTTVPLHFEGGILKPTADHTRLMSFAILYGLGYGASFTVLSAKPSLLFGGMPEFGKLLGLLFAFQMAGGFFGTLLTGKLRAVSGSYALPFALFVGMAAIACIHYIALEVRCCHQKACSSPASVRCSLRSWMQHRHRSHGSTQQPAPVEESSLTAAARS